MLGLVRPAGLVLFLLRRTSLQLSPPGNLGKEICEPKEMCKASSILLNVEALIIRIGFGGILYINITMYPALVAVGSFAVHAARSATFLKTLNSNP